MQRVAVVVFPARTAMPIRLMPQGRRGRTRTSSGTATPTCNSRCGDPARRIQLRRLPAFGRDCPVLAGAEGRNGACTRRRAVLGICNGFQILCEAGLLPGH